MKRTADGNPVRVLQVVTQMNRAGLECRLMDLYRSIDRNRIQFDFYTCRREKGNFDDEIISMGGKVYYNDPLSLSSLHRIPERFKLFLSEHAEYRTVHCHLNQWCGLILKGAKKADIPVRIAHSRTSLQKSTIKNSVKNLIRLPTKRYATHYFAVSRKAGQWLFGRRALSSGKVKIWPNAIDCRKFAYDPQTRKIVRESLGLGDELSLIHVGNLRPEKNHEFLFRIFKKVLEEHPSAKLILAGKDGMNGALRSLAQRLDIEKFVLFLGPRDDVACILQAGDVFVFPSLYEGFPGAVLEAEAAGLPCIISDTITDEVCITPLVEQLPLAIGAEIWAKHVLEKIETLREDVTRIIIEAGFDVMETAAKLEAFYISMSELDTVSTKSKSRQPTRTAQVGQGTCPRVPPVSQGRVL